MLYMCVYFFCLNFVSNIVTLHIRFCHIESTVNQELKTRLHSLHYGGSGAYAQMNLWCFICAALDASSTFCEHIHLGIVHPHTRTYIYIYIHLSGTKSLRKGHSQRIYTYTSIHIYLFYVFDNKTQ